MACSATLRLKYNPTALEPSESVHQQLCQKGLSDDSQKNFKVAPHASHCAVLALIVVSLATLLPRLALAQTNRECPVRVTLLQVNDVYQFSPVDGGLNGGLARVATLRKQIIAESPHTLFLMAGDTISPSIESNAYKGAQMIEAWNAAGLDYSALGNHEFDFGPDVLRSRI